MRITSNALKGLFCNPSKKYPIEFEVIPTAWSDDAESRAEEYRDASNEYENVVRSICPRLSEDGSKIIIEIYTMAGWRG